MPLFNYLCRKCNESSEILVRGSERPVCPHCGANGLVKQASAFAPVAAAAAAGKAPSPCESCCNMGNCPRM